MSEDEDDHRGRTINVASVVAALAIARSEKIVLLSAKVAVGAGFEPEVTKCKIPTSAIFRGAHLVVEPSKIEGGKRSFVVVMTFESRADYTDGTERTYIALPAGVQTHRTFDGVEIEFLALVMRPDGLPVGIYQIVPGIS